MKKIKILLFLIVGINYSFIMVPKSPEAQKPVVIFKKYNLNQGKWKIVGTNYASRKQLEALGLNYDKLKGWFVIEDANCLSVFQKKFIGVKAKVDDTITPDINIILVHNDSVVWEGHFLISSVLPEVFNQREKYRLNKDVMKIFNCAKPSSDKEEYQRLRKKAMKQQCSVRINSEYQYLILKKASL